MPTKFFGTLSIVVGVFLAIGGGCATLFAQPSGIITCAVGIALIFFGIHVNKSAE